MKEYKGWELFKLALERKIKEGDRFKRKDEFLDDEYILKYSDKKSFYFAEKGTGREAGNSIFANNIFTKIQKPLTFFEAIAKADEGKKVTNDNLKDEKGVYKGYYFKYNNKLYYHKINDDMDAIFHIHESEMASSWYIYEE